MNTKQQQMIVSCLQEAGYTVPKIIKAIENINKGLRGAIIPSEARALTKTKEYQEASKVTLMDDIVVADYKRRIDKISRKIESIIMRVDQKKLECTY